MNKRDWKSLIRDMEQQRCILMLGSALAGAEYEGEWLSLENLFALHLSKELAEEEGIPYDKTHQNKLPYVAQQFLTIPDVRRTDLEDEILEAYQTHVMGIPPIYEALAQYPFHLIINTTPDDFMLQALRKAGKANSTEAWYNFKKDSQPLMPDFSSHAPLVYNLFGSYKDPESLVLTAQDQVDFIKNIVKEEPPVPKEIRSQFDERKTYLFLNFDLSNWHFRLLLDGLSLTNKNKSFTPKLSDQSFDMLTKAFYEHRFNFKFINQDLNAFSSELSTQFEAAQAKQTPQPIQTKKLVILAATEDEEDYVLPLVKALKPLEQKKHLQIWHKALMTVNTEQVAATQDRIKQADVILVLLSVDLLAQDDVVEWKQAFKQHKEGQTKLFPILARSCDWEETELAHLQVFPNNHKPIADSKYWGSKDFALNNVVNSIKQQLL